MQLHILSDLHLEFAELQIPETGADIVVLAGDIDIGMKGVEWAARTFPDTPLIYVPGNHEYYRQDINELRGSWKSAPTGVHVPDNDLLEINGVRFLGCTLWTDFSLFGEVDAGFAIQRAQQSISDFSLIRNGGQSFTPRDSVVLHEASRAWLQSELALDFDGPTVVVTHYLPAMLSVASRYVTDPLSPAFASRLEDLMEKYQPELWIHGHTHDSCDYLLANTRVICNPRGYPHERSGSKFDETLIVEI
jgi:Icc-related predicted phosphoesterase